jgi:hypothetical protein
MYMIMLVLDDPNRLDEVVEAWQSAGVSGATILESMGAYRRRSGHVHGRYLFGLPGLTDSAARSQYTLFAIVPDQRTAQLCLNATEEVVGDLGEPNTGVFAAWELSLARGVPDVRDDLRAEE